MKTIKERAIEKYCTHCGARVEYNCSAMDTPCNSIKNYIEIATEQRKIDIDKACEYFADWMRRHNDYAQFAVDGLRKAMEE